MSIQFLAMDRRAFDYVRGELEATNRLGRLIAGSINLEDGRVAAVVPEVHEPTMYNFREAIFPSADRSVAIPGGYVEEVASTEEEVAEWLQAALVADSRRVLVSESFLLRAKDLARASHLPTHTIGGGEFVYFWATRGDTNDEIREVVGMAYPVPLSFAVLSSLPVEAAQALAEREFDADLLSTIAAGAECVFVGAYDGESILVWLRKSCALELPSSAAREADPPPQPDESREDILAG